MQAVAACEEKPPSGQWLRVSVDSFQATPVFKITTRIDSSKKNRQTNTKILSKSTSSTHFDDQPFQKKHVVRTNRSST